MSRITVRSALTAAAAAAFVLVGLTGCTSSSYSCSNGSCAVTLKGAGASTEIDDNTFGGGGGGSGETTFALDGVSDGMAAFSIGGSEASCTSGESVTVDELQVTCTEIGEDELTMEVTG